MVLDRRSGQSQAVPSAEQPGGLGRLAVGVLDRLRLVQDHVVELGLAQRPYIPSERAVGREHHVPSGEGIALADAADAGMVEHAQLWSEALRLGQPVEDQRLRHHDEGRGLARQAPGLQQGEHLDGLAQAHVIGQAAAEAEVAQEVEPSQAGSLIAAELSPEAPRRLGRRDSLEAAQALPGAVEGFVAGGCGLALDPGVEERDLRGLELEVVAFRLTQGRDRREPLEPVFGDHAETAVAEGHEPFAIAEGGEQLRQPDVLAFELCLPAHLEPIDAGRDRDPEGARGTVELPLGVDRPALGEERAESRRDPARGDLHRAAVRMTVCRKPESQAAQSFDGLLLGFGIAQEQAPLVLQIEAAPPGVGRH
jgi:hypothetical protein